MWRTPVTRSSYPPIEEMLPHRDPFLFIQSVLSDSEDMVVCGAMIGHGHYMTHDISAPPVLGIEMGAQAAGVLAALQNIRHESVSTAPRVGYLVGIRQARFHAETLPVGQMLRVEALFQGASGPLSTFEIRVKIEGEEDPLVEARISTWAEQDQST